MNSLLGLLDRTDSEHDKKPLLIQIVIISKNFDCSHKTYKLQIIFTSDSPIESGKTGAKELFVIALEAVTFPSKSNIVMYVDFILLGLLLQS